MKMFLSVLHLAAQGAAMSIATGTHTEGKNSAGIETGTVLHYCLFFILCTKDILLLFWIIVAILIYSIYNRIYRYSIYLSVCLLTYFLKS